MHRRAICIATLIIASSASAQAGLARRAPAERALARIERIAATRVTALWRSGTPSLVTGQLSRPSTGKPADIARRFLSSNAELLRAPVAELRERRILQVKGGSIVRFQQWHGGLPVFGAVVAVTLDADGVVRTVSATGLRDISPRSLAPQIQQRAAFEAAVAAAPSSGRTEAVERATLGLLSVPGGAKLAYRVVLPAVPALLSAPTLYIDAHDGRVLRRVNRLWFLRRGKVYMPNPTVNATAQEVDLNWLPDLDGGTPADGGPGTVLESSRVKALNCPDLHGTTAVNFSGFNVNVHTCSEIHTAVADSNLDFLYDPVADSMTPERDEDKFAEVQMFYHVNRIYDFYRTLGFTDLQELPIQATVNFRIPIDTSNPPSDLFAIIAAVQDTNGALYPFDNAFFIDKASASQLLPRDHDSMIFGQGTNADFAYDGDVIYHEFGHAVVNSTSKLVSGNIDDYGLDSAPGAMNEGYADYFAAALSGDGKVGEYAGSSLPAGQASGAIRDLGNSDVCPDHLWGEVHQDSQAFSAGLWQARTAMAAGDRPNFDTAVYTAMAGLSPMSNFMEAASATLTQIGSKVSAAARTTAEGIFQSRGLMGCNNRIIAYTSGTRPLTFVEGTGSVSLSPYVPGYYQLKYEVPSGMNQITLSYVPSSGLASPEQLINFGAAPDLRVIFVKTTPIQFVYNGGAIDNVGDFAEATPVDTGTVTPAGKLWQAKLSVTPGTWYVMLVNRGQGQGVVRNVAMSTQMVAPPDAGVAPDAGTGGGADAGTGTTADAGTGGGGGSGGGGCSTTGGAAPGLLGALLVALLLVSRRRRRV